MLRPSSRKVYYAVADERPNGYKRIVIWLLGVLFAGIMLLFAVNIYKRGTVVPTVIVADTETLADVELGEKFEIMVITDLDKRSKDAEGKAYHSVLRTGELLRDETTGKFTVSWGTSYDLYSGHNEAGRGMELSELIKFKGKLYTADDRTGVVFEILKLTDEAGATVYKVAPRHILGEGDGSLDKGMKVEWATVKGEEMVFGSFGKEYTNPAGAIISTANNWIVTIDEHGVQERYDWSQHYSKMREAVGATFPGYLIHEAGNWSPWLKKWVFLPRRVSSEAYDEDADEKRGSNKIILMSEDLSEVEVREVGTITPERGFSTFKFVPGSKDTIIVAIKSEEKAADDSQSAHITVFTIDGKVLLEETELTGGYKFEGLEIWAV